MQEYYCFLSGSNEIIFSLFKKTNPFAVQCMQKFGLSQLQDAEN